MLVFVARCLAAADQFELAASAPAWRRPRPAARGNGRASSFRPSPEPAFSISRHDDDDAAAVAALARRFIRRQSSIKMPQSDSLIGLSREPPSRFRVSAQALHITFVLACTAAHDYAGLRPSPDDELNQKRALAAPAARAHQSDERAANGRSAATSRGLSLWRWLAYASRTITISSRRLMSAAFVLLARH